MRRILAKFSVAMFALSAFAQEPQSEIPFLFVPIMGYQFNFPNGMQCAMVVAPPDTKIGRMPTYILWAGHGDKEIEKRQTVFNSAYEASKYVQEHCRVTPRWAKEVK